MRTSLLRRLQEPRLKISEKSQILLLIRIKFSKLGRLLEMPMINLIRLFEALMVLSRSRQEKFPRTCTEFSLMSKLSQQFYDRERCTRVAAVLLMTLMAFLRRFSSVSPKELVQLGAELIRAAVRLIRNWIVVILFGSSLHAVIRIQLCQVGLEREMFKKRKDKWDRWEGGVQESPLLAVSDMGKGEGIDVSKVGVFVFFENGLKLLLQLLEPGHLMRFALVPAALQLLHLLDNLSRSPLLEKLSVVAIHLFLETRLLLFVPGLLLLPLFRSVEGVTVIFDVTLILSQFLKLWRHFDVKVFIGIVKLPLHPHIFVLEDILEVLRRLLRALRLELPPTPFFIDLVIVHLHFLVEQEVARPSLFFLLGRVEDCMQIGLYFFPEELAELNEDLLGAVTIVEGLQFKAPLSGLDHAIDVINFGPDIVILDAFAQSNALPPIPSASPYVRHEIFGVDVPAEGAHGEDGMDGCLALSHQAQVHLQGLGNSDRLAEGQHFLGKFLIDVEGLWWSRN